ncbi:MAG: glycosyltransferase [Solobacterium sp.]|nr:glycosyltransferase [Solobacterium sp.]
MISIIIPIYNAEKELPLCLDSILKTNQSDFEIIAINDGSSDASGTILDAYAKDYPQIQAYHRENKGNSLTRDEGIGYAKGSYILFVDADDILEEGAIDLLDHAIEEDTDLLVFGYSIDYIDEHYTLTKSFENKNYQDSYQAAYDFLKDGSFNLLWNKVYRTSLIQNQHDFPIMKTTGQDFIFNCHVFPRIHKVQCSDKVLYHYCKRAKETMVTRYIENGYENLLRKKTALQDMLRAYGKSDSDAYQDYMLNEYEVYLINYFAKGCPLSKEEIIAEVDKNLMNEEAYRLIASAKPQGKYEQLFQKYVMKKSAKYLVDKYSQLAFVRDYLGKPYRWLRKMINQNQ